MKGTSKVIMGATLVMVLTLAMVLGLVLVLLAELYCSLLLRRRQIRLTTTSSSTTTAATAVATTTTTTTTSQSPQPQTQHQSAPPPLSSFYAHGVLNAPRKFLFPSLPTKEDNVDIEKQHTHLRQFLESHQTQESTASPHRIGLVISSPPPPSPSFTLQPNQQAGGSTSNSNVGCNNSDEVCGSDKKQFMYISNPIYDNDARPSSDDTPFETPDTSPSRLESEGSSSDDNDGGEEIAKPSSSKLSSLPITPPLSPMKKLPKEACSVSLRDARSLGTSGSDSNSNNGVSSSSSGTPCTSPSW